MQNSTLPPFCLIGLRQQTALSHIAPTISELLATWQQHPAAQQKWGFSTSLYCVKQPSDDGTSCHILLGRLASLETELPHPDFSAHLLHPQHYCVQEIQSHQASDIIACLTQLPLSSEANCCDFVVMPQYGCAKWYRSTGLASLAETAIE